MSERKIRPHNDYVLIRRHENEKVSTGGIHLVDNNQKSRMGEVLAVGPGKFKKDSNERIPMTLKPGDVVYMRGTSVSGEVRYEDEDLIFLREGEVLGLVES